MSHATPKPVVTEMREESTESVNAPDVRSHENMFRSALTQRDFVHALNSSMSVIPDPPEAESASKFPMMKLLQPDSFASYDLSTLCFIFFFRRGTHQQFFAARELSRRGWVFHSRYLTWFRRISEPTERTAEHEVAKYEYFDPDTNDGWCVRMMKPSFKFESAGVEPPPGEGVSEK